MRLRHDLQLLNDSGVINVPLTAWPISLGDINNAIRAADVSDMSGSTKEAVRSRARSSGLGTRNWNRPLSHWGLPHQKTHELFVVSKIRRERRAKLSAGLSWLGERFVVNLAATYAANPFDGEEYRPDGTYVGVVLGNWMHDGRLAGPLVGAEPGRQPDSRIQCAADSRFCAAAQHQHTLRDEVAELDGPLDLSTFMNQLDDDRVVNDALLWGFRGSIRPPRTGLEIGFRERRSGVAMVGPCDLDTFVDLLLGNDNQGRQCRSRR